ncbi:unnamed protein product [marine sediment metagenome]|uniref:Uncharacterized protein n=1 Tax=marine sediment metagenome TaxID=412755 RepID=X1A2H8_9ZZZZ
MSLRARACIKCRQYIVIHPDNPVNQVDIKKFERKHTGHTMMTSDLNEVKGIYTSYSNNGNSQTSDENI